VTSGSDFLSAIGTISHLRDEPVLNVSALCQQRAILIAALELGIRVQPFEDCPNPLIGARLAGVRALEIVC
jgi:hypothetical protein